MLAAERRRGGWGGARDARRRAREEVGPERPARTEQLRLERDADRGLRHALLCQALAATAVHHRVEARAALLAADRAVVPQAARRDEKVAAARAEPVAGVDPVALARRSNRREDRVLDLLPRREPLDARELRGLEESVEVEVEAVRAARVHVGRVEHAVAPVDEVVVERHHLRRQARCGIGLG